MSTENETRGDSSADAPREGSGLWRALGVMALAGTGIFALLNDRCTPSSALEGQHAPAFVLPVVAGLGHDEGDRIDLARMQGHVVVLDFWASWCPPCRASVPALDAFARAHPEVTVVGVNVETDRSEAFVRGEHAALHGTYPTVHDATGALQQAYSVVQLPTLLVIDAQGVVTDSHVGAVDEAWLNRHVHAAP